MWDLFIPASSSEFHPSEKVTTEAIMSSPGAPYSNVTHPKETQVEMDSPIFKSAKICLEIGKPQNKGLENLVSKQNVPKGAKVKTP